MKMKVLFVCSHNSARSQMAEELLRKMAPDRFEVESAGLEPGRVNPVVASLLLEEGIDISGKKTNDVFDFFRQGRSYHYVITVCDDAQKAACPIFPGKSLRRHWSFPDPSAFTGSPESVREQTRAVLEAIRAKVADFAANANYLKDLYASAAPPA